MVSLHNYITTFKVLDIKWEMQISLTILRRLIIIDQFAGNVNEKKELEKQVSQLLLLFAASLEAAIWMEEIIGELSTILGIDLLLETLLQLSCNSSSRLVALRSLNLYLSHVDLKKIKDKETVSLSIYENLKMNLSAPHHLVGWHGNNLFDLLKLFSLSIFLMLVFSLYSVFRCEN